MSLVKRTWFPKKDMGIFGRVTWFLCGRWEVRPPISLPDDLPDGPWTSRNDDLTSYP